MSWAEVVVGVPAARRAPTYTYEIPRSLSVALGHLVRVPFGAREATGVVFEVHEREPQMAARPLTTILDPRPVLTPVQLALATWVSTYYRAPLGQTVRLMLPPGLAQEVVATYHLAPMLLFPSDLPEAEMLILSALDRTGQATEKLLATEVGKAVPVRRLEAALGQLVRRGLVIREHETIGPKVHPKLEATIRLTASRAELTAALAEFERRSPRRAAAARWLLEQLPPSDEIAEHVWPARLLQGAIGGRSVVAALAERGLVALGERVVRRDPLAGREISTPPIPTLTAGQSAAWATLRDVLGRPGVHLLYGVTASGKTEIYFRLVAEALAQGKQAIVLVPEIALTPQTVQRFAGRFPGEVALLHSALSAGERFDEWRRARDGEAGVVIGSRSAVFAPLARLGLIIVDEEHEPSYKSDHAPRYHARDVAIRLGDLVGAPVVLGSATPDVVSFARARAGRYHLVELPERAVGHRPPTESEAEGSPALPPVEVVDMRTELKAGNRSIFSRALSVAIEAALSRQEQVILYLNRRGAATFVMCRDCGRVLRCRRCDASLIYHSADEALVCHLCNRREAAPASCPSCFSPRIRFFGLGTQRVEEEAARLFPSARIFRWDRDVVRTRRAHEEALRRFQSREGDVLVGTQMIAKGLDLPFVTLVGVIAADTGLHLPDFRAVERTFQLLTQVAGRAGRGAAPGKAIIQTYAPDHYCVRAASRHDYAAFAAEELRFRKQQGYPPYSQLVRIVFSQTTARRAAESAGGVARQLQTALARQGLTGVDVLGPAPAYTQRLRGKYRWQVILRGQPQPIAELLHQLDLPPGASIDVDPASLL